MSLKTRLLGLAAISAAGMALSPVAQAACGQTYDTTFASYGDTGLYFLVDGGDFENAAGSWTYGPAATRVPDVNNTLGVESDAWALELKPGAAVTTPSVCISVDHESLRFTAQADGGDNKITLRMLYRDTRGRARSMNLGHDQATNAWTPTQSFAIKTTKNAIGWGADGTASVRFVVASSDESPLRIDDFYVDPRMR
jgi:hypothetical protein